MASRVSALRGGLARLQVPQRPGRAVQQRLDEQRGHVRVGRETIGTHLAHRGGVVVVPPGEVAGRVRMRDTAARAPRRAPARPGDARFDAVERAKGGVPDRAERAREVGRIELLPRLVVVGPGGVPDPPPGHRAARVVLRRPPEAAHRLLVGERVAPHEAPVEPALRFVRSGRDRERDGSEIEVVVAAQALFLPVRQACSRFRLPAIRGPTGSLHAAGPPSRPGATRRRRPRSGCDPLHSPPLAPRSHPP